MKQPASAGSSRPAEADKLEKDNPPLQGEGNYKAARNYGKSVKEFVDKGQVESAGRAAQPRDAKEEDDMKAAEKEGLGHARH